jgi:predicted nuclease of predicted toxin-antitoxin system
MATFFFDNDISHRIVNALKQLVPPDSHEVVALRDIFPQNAKDTEWIPKVGEKEWVVVTRDANQRRRDAERKALRLHSVKIIYIRQSGKPLDLYADAARIIKNWPKISEWGDAAKPGEMVKLSTNDKIEPFSL